jgi:hypothetical protein
MKFHSYLERGFLLPLCLRSELPRTAFFESWAHMIA